MSDLDTLHDKEEGTSRRTVLRCMTWAGTGVLWTVAGGVPRSLGLIGDAHAETQAAGLTFLQISDSHTGFDKPANPNVNSTLEEDLKGKAASTPIVVFAHIPLWVVYPTWGWGTEDGGRALELMKRFGSVTVLNGHIHQVMQKVEGNVTFHTARSTAFPQPAPGTAPSPGPMKVEDAKLRSMLGIASVNFKQNDQKLAIIDTPLAG